MIVICAGVLVALLALLLVVYEREVRRMARFVAQREARSNQRISIGFSTKGLIALAASMNDEWDRCRDERIDEAMQRKAFQRDIASLSHDLRTPLAGAQGYLQLHARTDDAERQQHYIDEAMRRLDVMRELTDQLFFHSRIMAGGVPIDMELVCLYEVLSKVLAGSYPSFAKRGWEPKVVFPDESALVCADREALTRVLDNLVSNALRYGAGAPAILQVPNGLTISNKVLQPAAIDTNRLFDRFYRANVSRTGEASGLGLSIVAALCDSMGASVRASLEGDLLSIKVIFEVAKGL